MLTVHREFHFDACHSLPHLPPGHKCSRMHGHSYRVVVEVSGDPDPQTGFIIDYAEIGSAWGDLHDKLDHRCVDDFVTPSTSEALAARIASYLSTLINTTHRQVCRVSVGETATCGATWTLE